VKEFSPSAVVGRFGEKRAILLAGAGNPGHDRVDNETLLLPDRIYG